MNDWRKPVDECTADELRHELVSDFVTGVEAGGTIERFVIAIRKIAQEWHVSMDRAYQEIRSEALSLGGKATQFDR